MSLLKQVCAGRMDRHLEVQRVAICTACQEVHEIVVVELLGAND